MVHFVVNFMVNFMVNFIPNITMAGCAYYSVHYILSSTRLLIRMHERCTIELHIQVFLEMNTWLFETCQKHYN
jgi:hypothetical protein